MNFTITSGDNDFLNKEEEFIQLYNAGEITTRKIIERLDLTRNEYRKLRKKCLQEETIIKRRPGPKKIPGCRTNPRYYSRHLSKGHTYFIVRRKDVYYCEVKKERDAKEIVERLKRCGWNKDRLPDILEEVLG